MITKVKTSDQNISISKRRKVMLKEDTKDLRPQYNKKDTYTYEEVRPIIEAALEDRARYLAFFYKVMPRELFDMYAKKALYAYGEYKALGLGAGKGHEGDPKGLADFLVSCNGVGNTLAVGNQVLEETADSATVRMEGKCALVQGWEKMGLSPEEVEYLCDIASYGDYGHANALNLTGTWVCTSAQKGCDYCDFKIEHMKEKMKV